MLLLEEALAQDATWESWPGTELALRQSAAIAAVRTCGQPAGPLDRQQVLRLSLDEVATVLEQR